MSRSLLPLFGSLQEETLSHSSRVATTIASFPAQWGTPTPHPCSDACFASLVSVLFLDCALLKSKACFHLRVLSEGIRAICKWPGFSQAVWLLQASIPLRTTSAKVILVSVKVLIPSKITYYEPAGGSGCSERMWSRASSWRLFQIEGTGTLPPSCHLAITKTPITGSL